MGGSSALEEDSGSTLLEDVTVSSLDEDCGGSSLLLEEERTILDDC